MGGTWIRDYETSVPFVMCLALSCTVAVLVNISQFMCLGLFSAVTFQVTGHAKTVFVLCGSWLFLREHMGVKEVTGMALAVCGMVAYGYFASQNKAPTGGSHTVSLNSNEIGSTAKERLPLLLNGAARRQP
jgi:solute carrier family 35, member E3